jgi:hypothetical protein
MIGKHAADQDLNVWLRSNILLMGTEIKYISDITGITLKLIAY